MRNIPRIGDVLKMLEILKSMGSKQKWISEDSIEIHNNDLSPEKLDQHLVSQIRSSILLIGPLLARFGRVKSVTPGGCRIGVRPIDTHLNALRDLGAKIEFDEKTGIYDISLGQWKSDSVSLREFSVTATENLLMFGFSRPFVIKLAALEPHVFDLIDFLRKLGMEIEQISSHSFRIGVVKKQKTAIEHAIIPDPVEAVTLAILGAATKGTISIRGVEESHLEFSLQKLKDFGVIFQLKGKVLIIDGPKSVLRASKVQTLPYPGLPTDLQAPFGVLATQAYGSSLIFDTMYEGRLKYIDELVKMGANAVILDPHRALVTGPSVLHGTKIDSLDLRAGATLVIAALVAYGQTELGNIEQIDRGYENLDGRLRELGAEIKRSP